MKIIILAYGSLTQNLYSPYYEATLLVKEPFCYSELTLPVSFQDISCQDQPEKRRLCLAANSQSSPLTRPTRLYYAIHESNDLQLAQENLMQREGTQDPSHIAVIKNPKFQENSTFCPKCFEHHKIEEIEAWLFKNDFEYALLTQFPPKATFEEIQLFLSKDPSAQKRTLTYFLGLPQETQDIHREVLDYLGLKFQEDSSS